MGVTLEVLGIDRLGAAFDRLPSLVAAGVKVGPPGSAYAMAWEWGKISIKPGPKTMWSSNMAGNRVVLTVQAPHGYIRVNRGNFQAIIKGEISKVKLATAKMEQWGKNIAGGADKAAQKCCDLVRETAPVDKGDLRNSIEPCWHDDDLLSKGDGSTFDLGSFGGIGI